MASSVGAIATLVLLLATSAFAQQHDVNAYTCPTGFVPYQLAFVGGGTAAGNAVGDVTCAPDPCYKDVCGAGNSCQVIYKDPVAGPSPDSSSTSQVVAQCTCTAPAVAVGGGQYCSVPGSNPCSPNPCHNGGLCYAGGSPENSYGAQGSFVCRCPPPYTFGGPTCDVSSRNPSPTLKAQPSPQPAPQTPPQTSDQGVCGSGDAANFPNRCWFNNDPQGRYVCCDAAGCNGFLADNLFPNCQASGFVPPGYGAQPPPPPPPPSTDQGVCGTGDASNFPVRCYYNNDPMGRYVCCDSDGCDGFNPPDAFFPHCKTNGFVPPGMM